MLLSIAAPSIPLSFNNAARTPRPNACVFTALLEGVDTSLHQHSSHRIGLPKVSNPDLLPTLSRLSVSFSQKAAFATGVPTDLYAFPTPVIPLSLCTPAQYPKRLPTLKAGLSPVLRPAYALHTSFRQRSSLNPAGQVYEPKPLLPSRGVAGSGFRPF